MGFTSIGSTTCPNAAQNTRLRNLENCQPSNLRLIRQLHFITSQTQIPSEHVLPIAKDLHEKGLRAS